MSVGLSSECVCVFQSWIMFMPEELRTYYTLNLPFLVNLLLIELLILLSGYEGRYIIWA